jgi:hypothetical protein
MPTGIVYAIWSGLSIVLVTASAWVWSKQVPDLPALSGMALIIAGVVVINAFSSSAMTEESVSRGVIGSSQSQLSKSTLPGSMPPPATNPPRHVIQEGKFDWGWFKAYSDSSIELEANGEKRWYRNFAELERERKRQRSTIH